jgi:hypothetical protein
MAVLRDRHPDSDFGPLMRPYMVDASTRAVQKASVEPGDAPPEGMKFSFIPKIRCYVSTAAHQRWKRKGRGIERGRALYVDRC